MHDKKASELKINLIIIPLTQTYRPKKEKVDKYSYEINTHMADFSSYQMFY